MNRKPVIGLSMNYMQLGKHHQFHLRGKYVDAVVSHCALPLPLPCTTDAESIHQYLSLIDALVIIGGNDYPAEMFGETPHPKIELADPRRAEADPLLFHAALKWNLPILGICAGMQLMNIALGGKLVQHLDTAEYHTGENYHPVKITGGRWLPLIFDTGLLTVNSNHHQGLNPAYIGKGLTICAIAEDEVIEAVEYDSPQMVLGIQWHPERITDLLHRKSLFDFFIDQARLYNQ
ncbi:MAG: gamma-glutamyl-gamma-aminobutyrate hydrolase family protein [Candidatus Cloacimonadaceae bacterium]|nr:gamma-glutamyl-gamma-aminobutyrate hydrolase family protein [Candidatus Cloacimonadaceae bacterium]MDP3115303.1 gamma-glutamyl-gamma-aminobutyrate hydrolase family protein [Candidatus Cloacimonadaceae bacterium]